MLKLEKTSRFSGITVKLREKDRFFETRVLKALALALLIHVGGLLFFHVTPFSITSSYVFPPVQLKSDHSSQSISVVASSQHEEQEDEISPPFISLIPPLEIAAMPLPSSLSPSLSPDPHAFQQLEERLWPTWELSLNLPLKEPRIRLTISGDLADHFLIETDPLLNQIEPFFPSLEPAYVVYNVQMHEGTGALFWFERTESSGLKSVDQTTENILRNLRFASDNTLEAVTGKIHFVVLIE